MVTATQGRLDILKIHSRRMNLTRGINLKKISDQLSGASGAEIKVRAIHSRTRHIVAYLMMLTPELGGGVMCTGCLYRGRNVRVARTPSPRYARGF